MNPIFELLLVCKLGIGKIGNPREDRDELRLKFRQLDSAGVDVDGFLKAADFFLGAFCEQGELTGMDREHVTSQGQKTPVGSTRGDAQVAQFSTVTFLIADRSESFETMMQLGRDRAMAPIWMSICCMERPVRFNSAKTRPNSSAASFV